MRQRIASVRDHLFIYDRLDDADLTVQTQQVAQRARTHIHQKHFQEQAIAVTTSWMRRRLGMAAYDVQLSGALHLLSGRLVQLAPGEGKTLTIGLAAGVMGWTGNPCHIFTANEYLAWRDARDLQPFYNALGLRAGAIAVDAKPQDKFEAYRCDVTYVTAKQVLADYLLEKIRLGGHLTSLNMAINDIVNPDVLLMRGLHTAIVDEADSILIDEATTPLIISAPHPNPLLVQSVKKAQALVSQFVEHVHYRMIHDPVGIHMTEAGYDLVEKCKVQLPGIWRFQVRAEELFHQALMARDHFKKDEHFVVEDGKVIIVDESTGRQMPGRSWSYGLQQAIEAQQGLDITDPSKTEDAMSFQDFFRSYHFLCGASGTLQQTGGELWRIFRLQRVTIPSRLPSKLNIHPWIFCQTKREKIDRLIDEIKRRHALGQPILVGTRRVADSEWVSQRLWEEGLAHSLLNAKTYEAEDAIVAQAGQKGSICVATNMAGRGTDIKISSAGLQLGGLCVLMFEPHEAARIDWQLFGRAGRQGQVGEVVPFVCPEDDLWTKGLGTARIFLRYLDQPWFTSHLVRFCQSQRQRVASRLRHRLRQSQKRQQDLISFSKNG